MASNLQKPSITDIGNLLQKMPEVKLDEFRLTDFVMNEFYKHFDADLFAYMLKMELLEYWTIENQSLTQSWNSQELQRTVTAITEAIKSVTSIAEIAYLDNKDVNSLIGLLASLNVRKFIYILRFINSVNPDILKIIMDETSNDSNDKKCLIYRLKMIYRTNEIKRIYSSRNLQELNQILLELEPND